MGSVEITPLWVVRWRSRAPRLAFVAATSVLAALGAQRLITPLPSASVAASRAPTEDLAARALAEDYARVYLTAEPDALGSELTWWPRADGHDARNSARRSLRWTSVVADQPNRDGLRTVTVAVRAERSLTYLAVTVGRDTKRRLVIAAPPAIVGPPPMARDGLSEPELEVEDPAVRDVAARVVRHYLARHRQDLRADLDRGAAVTLPAQPLRLTAVDAITWVRRAHRVAVVVTAQDHSGSRLPLRYELALVRRAGRWLVHTVHVNALPQEGQR